MRTAVGLCTLDEQGHNISIWYMYRSYHLPLPCVLVCKGMNHLSYKLAQFFEYWEQPEKRPSGGVVQQLWLQQPRGEGGAASRRARL